MCCGIMQDREECKLPVPSRSRETGVPAPDDTNACHAGPCTSYLRIYFRWWVYLPSHARKKAIAFLSRMENNSYMSSP